MIGIWRYWSLEVMTAGVSDPKFVDLGCWAKSRKLPFLGEDSGSGSFLSKLKWALLLQSVNKKWAARETRYLKVSYSRESPSVRN